MAEGAPLLREYGGNLIEGSNPFLSASLPIYLRAVVVSPVSAIQVVLELSQSTVKKVLIATVPMRLAH